MILAGFDWRSMAGRNIDDVQILGREWRLAHTTDQDHQPTLIDLTPVSTLPLYPKSLNEERCFQNTACLRHLNKGIPIHPWSNLRSDSVVVTSRSWYAAEQSLHCYFMPWSSELLIIFLKFLPLVPGHTKVKIWQCTQCPSWCAVTCGC